MPNLEHDPVSRRALIESTLALGGAAAAGSLFTSPARAAEGGSIDPGSTILLQGDSITDAGRNKRSGAPNDAGAFGRGYAFMIGSYLLASHPFAKLKVYNRGISGNKVPDLNARWDKDCINMKPALVSILIGVNDIWHKLNGRYDGTVESYEKGFTALLERTKKALPGVRLVVCEPFVLKCGAVKDNWFPEMDHRRAAAKKVAKAAGATWVPFQTVFDDAVQHAPPNYWAGDGVHPSMAGHALMAGAWVDTVGV